MKRIAILLLTVAALAAQPPTLRSFVGTVVGFRTEGVQGVQVEIRPDSGDVVVAKFTADTIAQKIAPGERDLKKAENIELSAVLTGDRVLVTLAPGTPDVRRIVVMAASDIARRNEADQMDWRKRGVAGIVSAKAGNRITLKTRATMTEAEAVVTVEANTSFKRYAPDSVKFADAASSGLSEVNVGDQLRARGEKSADGLSVTAREVVFGTFVLKAGTITAVDPETKRVAVKELGTNKTLSVLFTADSQIKQMPEFPALMGGAGRGGMPAGAPGMPGKGGMMGGGPPGGGFDINQILEHMPVIKLADLKPGSTVVISSTKGARADQLTAIMVLSNAGMLLQMASAMSGANRAGMAAMGGAAMGSTMGSTMGGGIDSSGLGGLGLSGMMQ
jgi:hypothetical protein